MSNTEAKLKQLKVADLKDILQKASVTLPPKATKADLITKILATPSAIGLFNKQNSPNGTTSEKPSVPPPVDNDLLSPPEQFDWETTTSTVPVSIQPKAPVPVKATPATTTTPAENPTPAKPSAPATTTTTTTPASTAQSNGSKVATVNDELEKRKKRAERFGVPVVEPKQKSTPISKTAASQNAPRTSAEDVSKLQARAARFGVPVANSGQKRSAPIDKEEEERRKKRAERFGTTVTKT